MSMDSVKLARVEEGVKNLSKSFDEHKEEDADRFERNFQYMKARFDKIDHKLETLWDDKNKNDGMFTASKTIVMALWAVVVITINWVISGRS